MTFTVSSHVHHACRRRKRSGRPRPSTTSAPSSTQPPGSTLPALRCSTPQPLRARLGWRRTLPAQRRQRHPPFRLLQQPCLQALSGPTGSLSCGMLGVPAAPPIGQETISDMCTGIDERPEMAQRSCSSEADDHGCLVSRKLSPEKMADRAWTQAYAGCASAAETQQEQLLCLPSASCPVDALEACR